MIKDHVLLPLADQLSEVAQEISSSLNRGLFEEIVAQIPEAWLQPNQNLKTPEAVRAGYVEFLHHRLKHSTILVEEAVRARAQVV